MRFQHLNQIRPDGDGAAAVPGFEWGETKRLVAFSEAGKLRRM